MELDRSRASGVPTGQAYIGLACGEGDRLGCRRRGRFIWFTDDHVAIDEDVIGSGFDQVEVDEVQFVWKSITIQNSLRTMPKINHTTI